METGGYSPPATFWIPSGKNRIEVHKNRVWQSLNQDEKGYSVLKETTFDLPADFGKDQRVVLDLGSVEVMAKG